MNKNSNNTHKKSAQLDAFKREDYHQIIDEYEPYNFNNILIKKLNIATNDDIELYEDLEDIEDDYLMDILDNFDDIKTLNKQVKTFKGKKDINKVKVLIQYFSKLKDLKIAQRLSTLIMQGDVTKKNLTFLNDKTIQDYIYIIFNDYYTVINKFKEEIRTQADERMVIQGDIDEEISIAQEDEGLDICLIDDIKSAFVSSLEDLLSQIDDDNSIKSEIIKNVYNAKKGDPAAKEYVSDIMLKEAISLSKKFSNVDGHYDNQLASDLIQEAMLSGLNGIEKYDVDKNDNFIYYIRHWLKLGIYSYLGTYYNPIRIPSHIKQLMNKIQKIVQEENIENEYNNIDKIAKIIFDQKIDNLKEKRSLLKEELEDFEKGTPEYNELSDKIATINKNLKDKIVLNKIKEKVKDALDKKGYADVFNVESLLKKIEDGNEGSLEENIFEDKTYNLNEMIIQKENEEKLKQFLNIVLTDEEKTVIIHRYKLFGEDKLRLETLGKKLNKSAERVRQVLNTALQKLSIKSFDEFASNMEYSVIDKKFYKKK